MTAWSAKVWSSAICWSVKGAPPLDTAENDRAEGDPRAAGVRLASCGIRRWHSRAARDRRFGRARPERGRRAVEEGTARRASVPSGTRTAGHCAMRLPETWTAGTCTLSRSNRDSPQPSRGRAGRRFGMVSKTRWTSVGEPRSPGESRRSRSAAPGPRQVAFRRSNSSNSRAFSMAMTAWLANVFSKRDLLVRERAASVPAEPHRWARPRAVMASPPGTSWNCSSRTWSHPLGNSAQSPPQVRHMDRLADRRTPPGHGPRELTAITPIRSGVAAAHESATSREELALNRRTDTVPPQNRAALSATTSSTGCRSVGELADDLQDLGRRRLLLQGFGDLAVPAPQAPRRAARSRWR